VCVDFESDQVLQVLRVRVVCGRGCCGKWGVRPGDLYGCRKINVDNEPRIRLAVPAGLYVAAREGVRDEVGLCMRNVVEMLIDANRRGNPSRFMVGQIGTETESRHASR
jgi:hypothetical protein